MSLYLSTERRVKVAIAVCDRCKTKFSIEDLFKDPNSPGLRVCRDCTDVLDPWRLPPRATENITLDHPRPDTRLYNSQLYYIFFTLTSGAFIPGEVFVGLFTQATGTVNSSNNSVINYTIGVGLDFEIGETVVGATSGARGVVGSMPIAGSFVIVITSGSSLLQENGGRLLLENGTGVILLG